MTASRGVIETKTTDLGDRSYGAKKPVYVLTSSLTFSGGEEFAYDVQAFKRGVIVGETTGGGANPGGPQPLGHGFTVFVPTGLVKHPVTGTNWEGVGVKPDVPVAPELALLEAHRLAAESLAAAVTDARQSEVLRAIAAGLAEQKRIASVASSMPLTKSSGAARWSLHTGRRDRPGLLSHRERRTPGVTAQRAATAVAPRASERRHISSGRVAG